MKWFIVHEKLIMFLVSMLGIFILFAFVNLFIGWQMFKASKIKSGI